MPEYSESVCAMLLARDQDLERLTRAGIPVTADTPHVTLFYLGKGSNFSDEQIALFRQLAEKATRVSAHVKGVEKFSGENDDEVPIVLTLESRDLVEMNEMIRKSLKSQGIESESKFANKYKPHLTLSYGPKDAPLPLRSQVEYLNFSFDQMLFTDGKGNSLFWPLKEKPDMFADLSTPTPSGPAVIKLTDFSDKQRKTLAKKGQAMQGGGYPIRNESDLRNAIQAFGRAKNPEATKRHIKARARALGLTHLLPDSWKDSTVAASDTEDSAVVKLAKITRVERHKRRRQTGNTEDVNSYLRKILDAAGFGSGQRETKKGATVGKGESFKSQSATFKGQAASPAPGGGSMGQDQAKDLVSRAKGGARITVDTDTRYSKIGPNRWSRSGSSRFFTDDEVARDVSNSEKVNVEGVPEPGSEKKSRRRGNTQLSHEFTKAEALELRLAGVTQDDLSLCLSLVRDDDIGLIALGSRASLDRSPKKNWVESTGDLPGYVREIARSIEKKRGVPLSRAIALAIGAIKRWARGGGDVDADTRAKAAAAVAQWESLKARNKARKKD